MRTCSRCKRNEFDADFSNRDRYCRECRRKSVLEAQERKKNPRKCKVCQKELRDKELSRKWLCSPLCEIQFHVKISENGCWEWQGHKMNNGYGYISINQNKLLAHRISYKIFKGDVPDDKVLRHKCNNPICIYPEHLLIGDQRDNVHDAIRCGNIKRKLNWSQVCDMRIRHEKGEAIKDLRREFSIDYKTCQDIIKMKKWKKNPDET